MKRFTYIKDIDVLPSPDFNQFQTFFTLEGTPQSRGNDVASDSLSTRQKAVYFTDDLMTERQWPRWRKISKAHWQVDFKILCDEWRVDLAGQTIPRSLVFETMANPEMTFEMEILKCNYATYTNLNFAAIGKEHGSTDFRPIA